MYYISYVQTGHCFSLLPSVVNLPAWIHVMWYVDVCVSLCGERENSQGKLEVNQLDVLRHFIMSKVVFVTVTILGERLFLVGTIYSPRVFKKL